MIAAGDINDGAEWSELDIDDLKAAVTYGDPLEQAAQFLCRSATPFEVAAKAKELGLKWQEGGRRRKP